MAMANQGPSFMYPSKDIARERLKIVLVQDRAEANRSLLEKLRDEIVAVVARFAEVDSGQAEVRVKRQEGCSVLTFRVPVRNLRRVT